MGGCDPAIGIIWGVGPVLLLPTGTDQLLSAEKWGAGPTAVALTQQSGWTVGGLANHIWSFAGEGDRAEVNASNLSNDPVHPIVMLPRCLTNSAMAAADAS